jgi:hypothetical protein
VWLLYRWLVDPRLGVSADDRREQLTADVFMTVAGNTLGLVGYTFLGGSICASVACAMAGSAVGMAAYRQWKHFTTSDHRGTLLR